MVIFGIGETDIEKLQCMASEPKEYNLFEFDSLEQASAIIAQIAVSVETACQMVVTPFDALFYMTEEYYNNMPVIQHVFFVVTRWDTT